MTKGARNDEDEEAAARPPFPEGGPEDAVLQEGVAPLAGVFQGSVDPLRLTDNLSTSRAPTYVGAFFISEISKFSLCIAHKTGILELMNERIHIKDLGEHVGKTVSISGWVSVRRDHGKLIFLDVRDETGKIQVVVTPKAPDAHAVASQARSEWVLSLSGEVKARPENLVNADEQNGKIEFGAQNISVLSQAETPPFDPTTDTSEINEEARLEYRYIDLRSSRMQRNLRVRSEWVQKCREYLFSQGFVEIETPLLSQATPEGARDFLVPSRHAPGNFYALPQSPQQYKQLLMVSGFEKYFQIARCLRDEDLRADRGFEFTQIDLEMAFATQEDVMNTIEGMVIFAGEALGHRIKEKPFPRISYADAQKTYGADKFDLRTDAEKNDGTLAYAWVVDFPFFERVDTQTSPSASSGHSTRKDSSPEASSDNKRVEWTFTHNPFSMPKPEHLDWHMKGEHIEEIATQQYDLVCNGYESGGGSVRAHRPEILEATYKIMGYSDDEIQKSVGHMLEAFRHGAPPHGGIALGVERNVMNLTGETFLREVIAFPMTGKGKTAVMQAPQPATPEQLRELGLSLVKKEGKK
jgi:aspartyl-tRNA synthetase